MILAQDLHQQRVAFYIRVSTEDQVEKYGIDLQLDALKAIMLTRGKLDDGRDALVLAGDSYIYIDEGVSGQIEPRERPAFSRLMEDIELAPEGQRPFDIVIVYKIDRFARRLRILLDVVDFFEQHEIKFISVNESIDTTTPFGKAILGIMGVIAELEIETTRMRTEGGRKSARNRGVFMGNAAPFGFKKNPDKQLEIFEEEAQVVRDIFEWFVIENITAQQIADRLTESKILTPDASAVHYGKRKGKIKRKNSPFFWRLEKVRQILGDRIYLGEYWYNKTRTDKKTNKVVKLPPEEWTLSEFHYPPLIEPLIFSKAGQLLEDSVKRINLDSKQDGNRLYLLSGILVCDACAKGDDAVTWIGNKKKLPKAKGQYSYYYQCARKNRKKFSDICTTLPIPAEAVEDYVVAFVRKLLKDPKYVYKHHQNLESTRKQRDLLEKRRKQLIEGLNSIPTKIENLREQHTEGLIDKDKLIEEIVKQNKSRERYQAELDKVNNNLGKQAMSEGYIKTLSSFAEKYSSTLDEVLSNREETYKLLHALINKITIFSRPVTELDVIAGRKTKDQKMPFSIEIELKLPQEMIIDLAEAKFGAKSSNL